MAYRHLKRVLGETSLEKKCRILFGICLFLLITVAFWWVEKQAEELVYEITRRKGRDFVDMSLVKFHFNRWVTDPEEEPLAREMIDGLENQTYRYSILSLNDANTDQPEDDEERQTLLAMREAMQTQERKRAEALLAAAAGEAEPPASELSPVYAERQKNDQYLYYQPVYWKQSCNKCHAGLQNLGAVSAAEASDVDPGGAPFRVVKVIFPVGETQNKITNARAFLLAAAIVTVFVSMVALYIIVRYVIVKPLKHLRDVSDAVSRGKTELRAEIYTNDEFEDLAASFNRMLRHLTDAQHELRQVNTDLDAKVDQLAQMNMRLYEMNRLKSDFLANMSHELRTPLNSIIGFSDVLQGIAALDDKQKRYAQNIQKSGRLLLEMINDILDLAKMEAGKMELRLSEFPLEPIISAQCDMVRSLTEEKNIDLTVEVSTRSALSGESLGPLYQDQAKVQQILTNLLSNAIKFTPEGGRINVRAVPNQYDHLELTVADTGVGIAEEDREVIFEKFRQGSAVMGGDNLTREYSGTGLGLSIIKELSKLLGGEISFTSELGKGSTFKVVLPWSIPDQPHLGMKLSTALADIEKASAGT